ncbi:MAG: glycine cleavage system aminomethyltransferase GcvT, partial [Acidobacteriota bacterium]
MYPSTMPTQPCAVQVEGISHRFGRRLAVSQVDFQVRSGEIVGFLGPNGGGKTTLFRILATLLKPTAGRAKILGRSVVDEPAAVRALLGVVFQSPSLDLKLTAMENLRHHGRLYGISSGRLETAAGRALEALGIADRAGDRVEALSGGLQRRVELAKVLLHRPPVLLLDEPSSGLDPNARRDLFEQLERLRRDAGTTVLLTTHFMEEAERCDRVGIFDVSHMGEIDISGRDAEKLLQQLITNDMSKMADHSILYTLMCYENGGAVDDLLVHRRSQDRFLLCVNAANTDKDFRWILERAKSFKVEVRDLSSETAQLAVQGKSAEPLLQRLCDVSLNDLEYYHFKEGKIHQIDCLIARTGYTGEDGFEIYAPAARAELAFKKILEEGRAFNLEPAGLGARDTLRLEMGYALYGNEIDAETSPLEAGLGWVVKLKKDFFIGQEALRKQKEAGLSKKLA